MSHAWLYLYLDGYQYSDREHLSPSFGKLCPPTTCDRDSPAPCLSVVGGLQRYPATQSVIWSLQRCDWLPLVGSAALYHKEGGLKHFKENCLTNDNLSLGSSLRIVGVPQAMCSMCACVCARALTTHICGDFSHL